MTQIIVIGVIVLVVILIITYVVSQQRESLDSISDGVEITQQGKGGQIRYSDNGTKLSFFWEYSVDGGAMIMVPSTEAWDDYTDLNACL